MDRLDADGLKGVRERALRVREVEIVVDLVKCGLARRAVLEVERADAGLDFGGRRDGIQRILGRLSPSERE